MNPINPLHLTPKERFQFNAANIESHRRLVQTMEFQNILDYALLHYGHNLVRSSDQSAATHFKHVGAIEFVEVLKRLAEPSATAKPTTRDNLSQNQ
jgi:hypothetical protein